MTEEVFRNAEMMSVAVTACNAAVVNGVFVAAVSEDAGVCGMRRNALTHMSLRSFSTSCFQVIVWVASQHRKLWGRSSATACDAS